MSLFGDVTNKQVDQFAKTLAESVARRYPAALDTAPEKRMSVNRVTKVLEDTYEKAVEFQRNHRLGVYKKARLGNSFKWELKNLGYSDNFVDVATEGLIVYITRDAKPPAGTRDAG